MKNLIFILLFLYLPFGIGCDKQVHQESEQVYLRIINKSEFNFSSVVVSFGDKKQQYENIPSGEKSTYLKFKKAYRYGLVKVETDSSVYRIHATDFVGEQPLKGGKYSYILHLSNDWLSGKIKKD
ncbi:MAG TPA: hypothetical protein VK084_06505 [Chitinophagaceae bacterium]|nr:hypothetical protein [Chitinophagaceae bacterium]